MKNIIRDSTSIMSMSPYIRVSLKFVKGEVMALVLQTFWTKLEQA